MNSRFPLEKINSRYQTIAQYVRWGAMVVFAWMMLVGICQWPSLSHNHAGGMLPADDFEAIAKCLTGLVGMVLTDIAISLAAIKENAGIGPPKSPN